MTRFAIAAIAALILAWPASAQPKQTPVSLFGIAEQRQILQLQKQLADANAAQIAALQQQMAAQNQLIMQFMLQQKAAPAPAGPTPPTIQYHIYHPAPVPQYSPGGPAAPLPNPGPVAPLPNPGPVAPLPNPGPVAPLPNPGPVAPLPNPGPVAPLPPKPQTAPLPTPGPVAPAPVPNPGGVAPLPNPAPPVGYQRFTTDRPPVMTATITDRNGATRSVPAAVWRPAN